MVHECYDYDSYSRWNLLLRKEDDGSMVKEYVILAIILGGLFSGCIGEESITGKYVQVDDLRLYLPLIKNFIPDYLIVNDVYEVIDLII